MISELNFITDKAARIVYMSSEVWYAWPTCIEFFPFKLVDVKMLKYAIWEFKPLGSVRRDKRDTHFYTEQVM